jgi:hypothetical protein
MGKWIYSIILGQRISSDTNKGIDFIKSNFYKFINVISEIPLN